MPPTTTTSNPSSCRILTIATSIDQGRQFIQRLKSFAIHTDKPVLAEGNVIPWTISNKYYTADVHFEIVSLKEWSAKQAEGVPAVAFVWQKGEPYKDHIQLLSKELASHDPEVSLAIQMESLTSQGSDEDEGMDEFISSNGFEYIDGNNQTGRRALEDDADQDTPGLARVVDALSTIMWPTMNQSATTSNRKSRARELLDWAQEEEADDGLRALLQAESEQGDDDDDDDKSSRRKSRMQKEMDEFQRWLEEDENQRAHQDPWVRRDELGTPFADSFPTPTAPTFNFQEQPNGFEDDFNEFVGAPMGLDSDFSQESSSRLVPMHTGTSYMSLGSDFSGDFSRGTDDQVPSADEEELPSHKEVEETSKRIFGSTFPSETSPSNQPFENLDHDEPEFSEFDLSRVFSALQGMKDEISGIGDDEARRKAAARVALGLVYGLQSDKSDVDSEGEDGG